MSRFSIGKRAASRCTPHTAAYQPRHAFAAFSPPTARTPHKHLVWLTVSTMTAIVMTAMVVAVGGTPSAATTHSVADRLNQSTHAGAGLRHRETQPTFVPATNSAADNPVTATDAATGSFRPSRTQNDGAVLTGDVSPTSPLAADGIPTVALRAYVASAGAMAASMPTCHITWPLLAGIGRVESDHGRFGGATLLADGTSSRRILGPVLNGGDNATIADTDGGALDGDRRYDRAMGPMQFIPSTWVTYASDGNGDGVKDPFNIFDASLAAAKYLCVAGGNLSTISAQQRAVFSYNHLASYVNEVLSLERTYAASAADTGVDIGPVSGTGGGGTVRVGQAGSTTSPSHSPANGTPTHHRKKHSAEPVSRGGSATGSTPPSERPTPPPTKAPRPTPTPTAPKTPGRPTPTCPASPDPGPSSPSVPQPSSSATTQPVTSAPVAPVLSATASGATTPASSPSRCGGQGGGTATPTPSPSTSS